MKTKEWTFQRTHPWIRFDVNLEKAPASMWMNLGEARSKFDHIAGVPLRPDMQHELHNVFLAKGVHATTAIEGNTLTEKEIRKHMNGQLRLPLSQEYLKQEVQNILDGCNMILQEIADDKAVPALTFDRICKFNSIVLRGLRLETNEQPGQVRTSSVGVGSYLGAPAGECEHLLRKLCEWLDSDFFHPAHNNTTTSTAILKAILAHLYIAWIHPFPDGNGRTARLVEFQILCAAGVASPAAHLLSNHYNKTRSEYYRQLDRASKSGGDAIPFLEYAIQGLVEGLVDQLWIIKIYQWHIMWLNYIHDRFGHHKQMSPSELRQHHLAIDLSDSIFNSIFNSESTSFFDRVIPIDEVRKISPRMIEAYSRKGQRTLRRDLNKLKSLDLIEEKEGGVRVMMERILAFLPTRCFPNSDHDSIEQQQPSEQLRISAEGKASEPSLSHP